MRRSRASDVQRQDLLDRIPVLPASHTWGFSAIQFHKNPFYTRHHVLVGADNVTWCRWTEGIVIKETPRKRSTICRDCLAKLEPKLESEVEQ